MKEMSKAYEYCMQVGVNREGKLQYIYATLSHELQVRQECRFPIDVNYKECTGEWKKGCEVMFRVYGLYNHVVSDCRPVAYVRCHGKVLDSLRITSFGKVLGYSFLSGNVEMKLMNPLWDGSKNAF
jgi:hypothetical protein